MHVNQVIIDGAVLRPNRERSARLLDYLQELADVANQPIDEKDLQQWKYDLMAKSDDYEFWHEMEDEIIEAI